MLRVCISTLWTRAAGCGAVLLLAATLWSPEGLAAEGDEDGSPDWGAAEDGESLPVEPPPETRPVFPDEKPASRPSGETPGDDGDGDVAPPESAPAESLPAEDAGGDEAGGDPDAPRKLRLPFSLGSYGRISAGTDMRGGAPERFRTVAYSPRDLEDTYLELDVYFHQGPVLAHTTLAFDGPLFHFQGDFDGRFGVRNLYAEARDVFGIERMRAWIGSRMVRGDDIYLLDFWPLDELNTVGAGLRWDMGPPSSRLEIAAHIGVNRLNNLYQLQTLAVPSPTLETEEVVFLNRLRVIGALRATYERRLGGDIFGKVRLYGEGHGIGEGVVEVDPEVGSTETLPRDFGMLFGAQIGLWGFGETQGFANLFARVATGLAAYGELAVPFGLDADRRAGDAREVLVGFSGNYDFGPLALTLGSYVRYFRDADPNVFDRDDLTEGVGVLRVTIQPLARAHVVLQGSYEGMLPRGLNAAGNADRPAVWRFTAMPVWSPFGRGAFTRPHLRLVYNVAVPNADARALLEPGDPRALRRVHHFFGVSAEWWFNSSFR